MTRWILPLIVVGFVPITACAQTQKYMKMDKTVVATNNPDLWQFVPVDGAKGGYYQCLWMAFDKEGKEINRQMVIYFPNAPQDANNTEKSNYWVYWIKLAPNAKDLKDIGPIWGRCPTPKHPMYKQMQKQAAGFDLWQIIPEANRKKEEKTVANLKGLFGPTFSTEATKLPKIGKDQDDTITCIDFTNAIFN